MIEVTSNILLSLFTGGPKILIVSNEGADVVNARPALGVEWLEATTADGMIFRMGDKDNVTSPLQVPPSNVLVVWIPDADIPTDSLKQWWARSSGVDDVPIFVHGNLAVLLEAVAAGTLSENARLTQLNQRLLEDLAAMREGLAHHVRVPPELEILVKNLRVAAPRLIFETPCPRLAQSVSGRLKQPLFVGARGLLGFDLHILQPGTGQGYMQVILQVPSSGLELAHWEIPFSDMLPGWLALRLEKALARMDSSVELVLISQGGEVAPEISCTPSGLMPEFALRDANEDNEAGHMLQMRIWGNYPGLSYELPEHSAMSQATMNIQDHLISAAETTRPLTWAYPYFSYLGGGRLLLRPLRENPASAAKIALPAFPGLCGISCTAAIDDALCQTKMLVRLAVSRPGESPDDVEKGLGALAITEWVELSEPVKPFEINLGLSQSVSEPLELHLFSRLPRGGKLDHGKVSFAQFKAVLNERAAFGRLPYLPVADCSSS